MSAVAYPHDKDASGASSERMLEKRTKRQTFEMDPDLHSRLKVASAKEGIYIRDILAEATKAWLKQRGY